MFASSTDKAALRSRQIIDELVHTFGGVEELARTLLNYKIENAQQDIDYFEGELEKLDKCRS